MIDDIKLHKGSDYIYHWNFYDGPSSPEYLYWHAIYIQKNLPTKIRIYNNFFNFNDLFFMEYNSRIYLSIKQIHNYKPIAQWISSKRKHLRFMYESEDFLIRGYYTTNTHLVLCGPPHAKTLINSYKNNRKDTMLKLRSIVGSDDLANNLIYQANKKSWNEK